VLSLIRVTRFEFVSDNFVECFDRLHVSVNDAHAVVVAEAFCYLTRVKTVGVAQLQQVVARNVSGCLTRNVRCVRVKIGLRPQVKRETETHASISERVTNGDLRSVVATFAFSVAVAKTSHTAHSQLDPQTPELIELRQAVVAERERLPRPQWINIKQTRSNHSVTDKVELNTRAG